MTEPRIYYIRWRHNGCNSVSNHQPHHCLLNRLLRRRSKKTSKLRVTGLCAGNSPGTGEFPAQMASYAENVSTWWRHHGRGFKYELQKRSQIHYSVVIMTVMVSQITGVSIVYSTVCAGADQRKHQSSASLAFVRGIRRCLVNSLHLGPVTPKMFLFPQGWCCVMPVMRKRFSMEYITMQSLFSLNAHSINFFDIT